MATIAFVALIALSILVSSAFLGGRTPVHAQADDPPVNFRVTGTTDTSLTVAWSVPEDLGITDYALQRYKHDGTQYVSEGSDGLIDGSTSGGYTHFWSMLKLDSETQYKLVLKLLNEDGDTVRESSATTKTLKEQPPASTDATLSAMSLSGITLSFDSATTTYSAEVANDVSQVTVSATTTDSNASYSVTANNVLYHVIQGSATVPLQVGQNTIEVRGRAEDRETTKTYTVTVTRAWPPATLSSLSLSGIPLSFAWDTNSYTASVANDVSQTTVSATVRDQGGSYQVKLGGVVDADGVIPLAVGQNVITVEVAASGGSPTRTYTVTVTRARSLTTDAALSRLTVSGSPLWSPSFSSSVTAYALQVGEDVSEVTVTATPSNSNARYVVKLGSTIDYDRVVSLDVGRNVIKVEVTAEDGETTKVYTLAVTRTSAPTPTLGDLSTDDPPVNFRVTGTTDTSLTVAWSVPKDRGIANYVLQRYQHDGTQYVSEGSAGLIDGTTSGGYSIFWSMGKLKPDTRYKVTLRLRNSADITIIEKSATTQTLPAQGPASTDATLGGMSLSGISLSFDSATTTYSAEVANSVAEVTVSATTNDSNASYVVVADNVLYTQAPATVPLQVGKNVIVVSVLAADRETRQEYIATVTRAWPSATLSALSLSGITLPFEWDTTEYSVTAVNGLQQTAVSATVRDTGGSYQVKLGGVVDADGVVPLAVGQNVITVEVAASGGSPTRTYTVTVTRARSLTTDAALSRLTVSGSPLWSPSFSSSVTAYALQVGEDVSEVTVTATPSNSNASYLVKLGGTEDHDGVIELAMGRNDVTVEVTAQDGTTKQTYSITITRTTAPPPTLGELPTDDPPVNLRVRGVSDTHIAVDWSVPKDRGITNYVLQSYQHDGTQYVSEGSSGRREGLASGGSGYSRNVLSLEPDTNYKLVLYLRNSANITIIEKSVTGTTLPGQSPPSGNTKLGSPTFTGDGVSVNAAGEIEVSWTPGANAHGQAVMLFTSDFEGDPVIAMKGLTDTTHTFVNVDDGDYVVIVVAFDEEFEDFEIVSKSVSVPGSV